LIEVGRPSPREVYLPPRAKFDECIVHGRVRTNGTAFVTYGLPRVPSKEYCEARRMRFPDSWREVGGGCVVQEDSPLFVVVR
jgi:hypothetical protein